MAYQGKAGTVPTTKTLPRTHRRQPPLNKKVHHHHSKGTPHKAWHYEYRHKCSTQHWIVAKFNAENAAALESEEDEQTEFDSQQAAPIDPISRLAEENKQEANIQSRKELRTAFWNAIRTTSLKIRS
jgi:hypothetical protein